ncbi:MAG: hypothetical protein NXI32_27405 [bacterium]|nr:hypothetical protein [bacterium]
MVHYRYLQLRLSDAQTPFDAVRQFRTTYRHLKSGLLRQGIMDHSLSSKACLWLQLLMLGTATLATVAAVGFGTRVRRINKAEAALQGLEARYEKISKQPANYFQDLLCFNSSDSPMDWPKAVANWIAADIVAANIHAKDFDDERLGFIEQLVEVRDFELHSNLVTDRTLELISRLPNLRCLTLGGGQFSAVGLLQLRNHPKLARLRIQEELYTPIEIATLRCELCGVQVEGVAAAEPRSVILQQSALIAQ